MNRIPLPTPDQIEAALFRHRHPFAAKALEDVDLAGCKLGLVIPISDEAALDTRLI